MSTTPGESYRRSDVPWLAGMPLPLRWHTSKLKHLTISMKAGEAITAEAIEPTGRYPVFGANGIRGYTSEATHRGTFVLVGRQGALCGNIHLATGSIWASEHTIVCTPRPEVDAVWLSYLMGVMNLGQYSMTAAQPGIGVAQIAGLPVPVPSAEEQRAMADFLDLETAKIDALIAKQEKLIALLVERRDALHAHYFYGADGKRVTMVRRVLSPLNRPATPGLGVITAYRDGVVTLRSNRRDEGYTFSEKESGYQEVRPGDLVFHALDGFAGAVGISDSRGNATPVYHVCRVTTKDDPLYISMLLRFMGVSGLLATQAPNVRQRSVDFRNWGTFARVPIALPDPQEQRRIAGNILTQSAKIDAVITKAELFIKLAKERRAALVTAAVTGEIDVRGAA